MNEQRRKFKSAMTRSTKESGICLESGMNLHYTCCPSRFRNRHRHLFETPLPPEELAVDGIKSLTGTISGAMTTDSRYDTVSLPGYDYSILPRFCPKVLPIGLSSGQRRSCSSHAYLAIIRASLLAKLAGS